MSRLGKSLRSRLSPSIVISLIALVLATSGWAVAASGGSSDGTIYGCVVKQGSEKGLLRVVAGPKCPKWARSIAFNQKGPAGATGAPGASGPAGSPATLPPLEAVHFVGAPGQPGFEEGSKNSEANNARAGFWKDRSGVVHFQGAIDAGAGNDIFRLPKEFWPPSQVCFSVPGFIKPGAEYIYKTNRLCVLASTGEVRNSNGEGVTFINLDGAQFRTD
jgi:hypothetical protein